MTKIWALTVVASLMLAACGGSSDGNPGSGGTGSANEVAVATAASVRPVVDKLAAAFEAANPGLTVAVTVQANANVTTLAIAEKKTQVAVIPAAWLGTNPFHLPALPIGQNLAVIAVPTANPANVTGPEVFGGDNARRTRVCSSDTSYGSLALVVLAKSLVIPPPSVVSKHADCPSRALADVAAGKLNAAFLFRSDLTVPEGVKLIQIPPDKNLVIALIEVLVVPSPTAKEFTQFLASAPAKEILTQNGYLP